MNENFIIGLTGRFGAGSTTTSNLILSRKEKDFVYFSLSAHVKEVAKQRDPVFDKKPNKEKRVILQNIGDEFRSKGANSFLVDRMVGEIKKALETKNVVIDSIRNQNEVKALRNEFSNFYLFAIDATTKNRWARLKELYENDEGRFGQDDKRDAGGDDEPLFGQQVSRCMDLADVLINNDRDFLEKGNKVDPVEEYGQKIERFIKLIREPGNKDPSYEELYMHHACSTALRSLCLKRQVGAVLIRPSKREIQEKDLIRQDTTNNYLVASGCNNAPLGAVPCGREKGGGACYRDKCKEEFVAKNVFCKTCGFKLEGKYNKCSECGKKVFDIPGKILDLCRSIHAEEAAILQAARLGTSIDGTVLYTSTFPCYLCSKKIVGSGISKVIYLASYPMQESVDLLEQCGIVVQKFEGVNSRAFVKLFLREILN